VAANSKIEWTDKTWNPLRGCSMAKGSELGGCLNCYAARMAARNLPELKSPTTGDPFARILPTGPRWTGEVELIEHLLDAPLHWRKPQRIFVNSMSDLFHETVPFEDVAAIYGVMLAVPQHTHQILTKRPEIRIEFHQWLQEQLLINDLRSVSDYLIAQAGARLGKSLPGGHSEWRAPHIWEGVSVEDQATADTRIPLLLETPAAIRFLSYEPALQQVDFSRYMPRRPSQQRDEEMRSAGIDWIIVGGESGPRARPFDIAWARNAIKQCRDAGALCFVKQLGAKPVEGGRPFGSRIERVAIGPSGPKICEYATNRSCARESIKRASG
jgi:protein gp37